LTPNDEANCSDFRLENNTAFSNRCDCNKEGNYTCTWNGEGNSNFVRYNRLEGTCLYY